MFYEKKSAFVSVLYLQDPKEVGPAADLLYSDDPEEMCRVVCSICNLEMFRHKFNFHKRYFLVLVTKGTCPVLLPREDEKVGGYA